MVLLGPANTTGIARLHVKSRVESEWYGEWYEIQGMLHGLGLKCRNVEGSGLIRIEPRHALGHALIAVLIDAVQIDAVILLQSMHG